MFILFEWNSKEKITNIELLLENQSIKKNHSVSTFLIRKLEALTSRGRGSWIGKKIVETQETRIPSELSVPINKPHQSRPASLANLDPLDTAYLKKKMPFSATQNLKSPRKNQNRLMSS